MSQPSYIQPKSFDPAIAHILQPDPANPGTIHVFQVLNAERTELDEGATAAAYDAWLAANLPRAG